MDGLINPFANRANGAATVPTYLSEANFAEMYAAAQFAWDHQLFFETSVTITWAKLGLTVTSQIQANFTAFLKGVRAWLDAAAFPAAYMYAHEMGPVLGLHTHFIIALPPARDGGRGGSRVEFKRWLRIWQEHRFGRDCPRAIRARGPNQRQPWLHWLLVNYLMKGHDPAAIVQSACNAPDGRNIFLSDLVVFAPSNPGHVPLNRRFGVSHSLGPDRRALGAPGGMDYLLRSRPMVDPFLTTSALRRHDCGPVIPAPYRSKYEDGVRDIRLLYPAEFLTQVAPLLR